MDDPAGPSKRLRKTTSRDGMLTSEDLNHIMNWSSDEDIDSGSSWSGGNREYIDSSDDEEETPEQAEPNVQQTQSIQNGSDVWHEEKYMAQPIPFTGTTGLIVSPAGNNPYDFFKLCANETLFTFIVEQTNYYAEEIFLSENVTDKSRITKWKILTVAEFKVFLGLLYHMGTIRTNRLQDYWKRGYLFDLPCFNSRMSRDRWMLILRCLHFAKNPAQDDAPQPRNRLYKINPLLDIFHENIDRIQYPTRVLAIDESMVLWRGRLVFRQFIHGKRHKYGIKMYVLTDSLGFVLKCIIYSGSNDTEVGGKGHVTNVVKKLLEGKLGVGHSIYMDNYYNSVELAQYLLNNNTYCTGTLRANRKNNPQEVIKKKLNKGEMIQRFTQEGTCIMKWRDRRDVLVILTEYDGTLVEEINKKGNQITKPKAILQYNKFMGGIDHSDQMLSYYSCEHKTMRWYKKLGIHILQIILVNSHNLFNRYSGSKLNLYEFRLSVIETLIKEGLETTLAPRFTPQPKTGNHYPKMVERNEKKKKKVRRCQECIKTKKRSETDIYCPTCPELHIKEKIWEEKFIDQQRLYEHSERQELLNKNKELQEAESVIINQKEKIHILNAQQKDEVEALQKTLQSNKHALDAMKKTLDNEKAFRICADQEITNLKEQIKCNTIKYKSLENDNKKLQSDKLKLEEAQSKIKQQCNELLQKNISLENHCEKREQIFDGQTNLINTLENNITVINEKLNNHVETEEENNKLRKQIKLFSKQMETYENEREIYVQRLQNMQKEENVFKCIINDLKQEIDVKNNEINNLTENTTILNSKNSLLSSNINILQENFTNCLKLLDELFENYVKQNSKIENNKSPLKMRPLLNETFELFEHTLAEYKLFKLSSENSEKTLKDEINQKEKIILSLKDKMDNYKKEIFANEITNLNYSEIKNSTKNSNLKQTPNENIDDSKLIINVELEKNLKYLYTIKNEILPKQKILVTECVEFMLNKIEEIENLNISKNSFIDNVHIQIISLKKEIVCKNINIKELKTEILNLRELVTAKDALCNEMDMELQHLKENLDDSSSTSTSKGDNIYKMREIDESQEDRSQKLKAIAIKQKKQIADLKQSIENEIKKHSLEKSELMNKVIALAEQSKLARCLQQQYDIKCDEYDIKCTEIKELLKKCNQEENQLLEQTNLCTTLKSDIEILKNDLSVAQNTIISLKEAEKSLNSRLDIFKQEKSAAEILKADRESSIKELSNNLKVSKEKIKSMESELEKLKTEKQKINIRDLELNSYEKTLDELSQKVKEEKQHSQNLEQELSNANSVIDSLHEQIKHLEHIIITEQERNKQNLHQLEVCRIGLNNAESLLNEKENNLIECQLALNQENILNTNLTSKYDELQKLYETEKENYQLQHSQLTEKIRRLQVEIKTANESISKYTEENQSLLDEFEAYKVRAHSVFQKHKQDTVFHGKVAELSEQLQEVTKTLNLSKNNLQSVSSELSNKNTEMILLQKEIDKYEKKLSYFTKTVSTKDKEIYRLSNEIENIKSLLEKEKTSLNENILNERLAHENEINRLQQEILLAKETNFNETESNIVLPVIENKLKKSTSSNHIHDDDEMFSDFASSNESVRKISKSTLMPLADLLSFDNNSVSDPISELNTSQKQLKQLTMMLNDAEKNCSRYEQQNKFLKEDIRRLQRSVDRHAEIQNMEYLKNIILKFITLSNGVEKYHLVPVINKLLKLSPDEQKQIETIAKGSLADQNSSWSNLFTWSQGT